MYPWGNFLVQPLQWCLPLGWNGVKVSQNLGATLVVPVASLVTSLSGILSENLLGIDLGPLSKILAVEVFPAANVWPWGPKMVVLHHKPHCSGLLITFT